MSRLLSALLVVLALTACAGSADDDYRDEFPSIARGLAALSRDVDDGLRGAGGSDDAALAAEFDGYARRLGELRERLERLDAPDRLAADHDELLGATAATRAALADVAAAARGGDAPAAREAAIRVVRAGERLDAARGRVARAVRRL